MPDAVGFIGLGAMGRPMALNLRKHGVPVVVHNRSHAAERVLAEAGASVASSPAAVAAASHTVVLMLPDAPDVAAVLEGPNGLLAGLPRGAVVIDASTIAPAAARRFAGLVAGRGAAYLDAPVSGGEIGAIDGTLTFMVGGDAEALDAVRPLLAKMGREDRIVHVGPSGAGQVCKACNQLVIGGTMVAVAEALALARKTGVDGAKVRQALMGGFAASRVLGARRTHAVRPAASRRVQARLYKKRSADRDRGPGRGRGGGARVALVQQLVHAPAGGRRRRRRLLPAAQGIFRLAGLN
ncbi:MAG: NAD(P)-dependent oxidoreductase [Vicinamibacterales bacterium]